MFLIASNTFWPSLRTPSATSSEIEGRLLVKTHAHDRAIKNKADDRLIGERAGVPGVPVAFGLRQTRLTVSSPTAPPNSAASARRTRRVLVPER